MVLPQSGGENQGGRFKSGKAKIIKIPSQKTHFKRLKFIQFNDIIKYNFNPYVFGSFR